MFPLTKDQYEAEKEKVFQNSIRYYHDKIEKNEEFRNLFRERYAKLKVDNISDVYYVFKAKDTSLFSERMHTYIEKRK